MGKANISNLVHEVENIGGVRELLGPMIPTLVYGSYIDEDGVYHSTGSDPTYCATHEYIPVPSGTHLIVDTSLVAIAGQTDLNFFYSAPNESSFLNTVTITTGQVNVINAPSGGGYFRFMLGKALITPTQLIKVYVI